MQDKSTRTWYPLQLLAHPTPVQNRPHWPTVTHVVDKVQLVNRVKHPMRVSKLSAHRSVERGWATNQRVEMCQWSNVVGQVIQRAEIVGGQGM